MVKRIFWSVAAISVTATLVGGAWTCQTLRASLPQLAGERRVEGLSAPVHVERDHLGIPTIRGATRADVARATGFLHAQDRFFQMDLLRRRAAGELAALVGPPAVNADRAIRLHRLRSVASEAVALLEQADRTVLEAYVAGVNVGLAALGAKPFEYYLLRQEPEPWRAEDSLLVVLTMFVTLQDSSGAYESTLGTMRDLLPAAMLAFLAPRGTEWDTPVIGEAFEVPAIPGPQVYDPRTRRVQLPTRIVSRARTLPDEENDRRAGREWHTPDSGAREAAALGSNNFAVAGSLTADGSAIVANDMHLAINVPNTWYRAAVEWGKGGNEHQVIGVTLPGMPAVVVGSNTRVAWGFTNSYGDWGDLVELDLDPTDPGRYRTPDGFRPFERHDEIIRAAGAPDEHLQVDWTIWGPVLGRNHRGRLRAHRWVAHDAGMLASGVAPLETARTVDEAMDEANGAGTPAQNMVVVDRDGRIGWTVYGSIPRRFGMDGSLPSSWADGTRGWSGWLDDHEYPRIVDPPGGRLWTANARVVDGEMLARIGDGSYEVGSRARIIRDRLLSRERFTPRDLLSVQLDTQATFLERWRDLVLRTLTPDAVRGHSQRARFREVVDRDWTGEASPDSAGYRLTRAFRDRASEWVFAFVLADCYDSDEGFNYTRERKREGPLWKIVTEEPLHLLDPRFASWDEFLAAVVDDIVSDMARDWPGDLGERRWSEVNVTAYRHPLSAAVPFIGRWLDMPARALPGDLYTPRVASGAVGASERMVVAPGKEADGIMETPVGQSGHPLSAHYGDSHDAWVRGEPTPFLPGPALHVLELTP